jgi:hypothetical protein
LEPSKQTIDMMSHDEATIDLIVKEGTIMIILVVAVVAVGTCVKQLAVTTPSILNYKSL